MAFIGFSVWMYVCVRHDAWQWQRFSERPLCQRACSATYLGCQSLRAPVYMRMRVSRLHVK